MEPTLVIINPRAASGRAQQHWQPLASLMQAALGPITVQAPTSLDDLATCIRQAYAEGVERIIAVGGDGTCHTVINTMLNQQATLPSGGNLPVFGQLPIGTGQDFARHLEMPRTPQAAIDWLACATPHPVDIGHLRYAGRGRYFLNIASVGISGEVDRRIEGHRRYPWSFWWATVRSFLSYQTPHVTIHLDGQPWYDGAIWLLVVANGRFFGRGMAIAPQADISDGQFEVILVKDASRLKAIQALNTVYSGQHLDLEEVRHQSAQHITLTPHQDDIALDLDGEYTRGHELEFTLQSGLLRILR